MTGAIANPNRALLAVFGLVFVATFVVAGTWLSRATQRSARLSALALGHTDCPPVDYRNSPMSALDFVLIIQLFIVAFKQGVSIPQCLIRIGGSVDTAAGEAFIEVGQALNRGALWSTAWAATTKSLHESERAYCLQLAESLESSWRFGASPIARLEALAEALLEREAVEIEVAGSKLGVALLIPTGLCFLPAFILIGVVPAVASFMGGSLG